MNQVVTLILTLTLVGCGNYQTTFFRVVDASTGQPVEAAKLTTIFGEGCLKLSHLFRPNWTYAQDQEAFTDDQGLAVLQVPFGGTMGTGTSHDGKPLDPEDNTMTTVFVVKDGLHSARIHHSNNEWRKIGSRTTPGTPMTIRLKRR